jgi:hypothetical protein
VSSGLRAFCKVTARGSQRDSAARELRPQEEIANHPKVRKRKLSTTRKVQNKLMQDIIDDLEAKPDFVSKTKMNVQIFDYNKIL